MMLSIIGNEQKLSSCNFNSEFPGYNYYSALQFTASCCRRYESAKYREPSDPWYAQK